MTKKAATISDIASALGLSRNTVSRVINNTGVSSERTRLRVLDAARAMGYGIKPALKERATAADEKLGRNISFVTRLDASTSYFFSSIFRSMDAYFAENGCMLSLVVVRPNDMHKKALSAAIRQSDGIVCADIFSEGYLMAIFSVSVPVVMIDSNWDLFKGSVPHTAVMMENDRNVEILTGELLDRGHTNVAFIGDPKYCRGFYERYRGYLAAHTTRNKLPNTELNVFLDANVNDLAFLRKIFGNLKTRPTAFVCVNDFAALSIMRVLKDDGVKIPEEVEIVGFDDIPQWQVFTPELTTVHTFTEELGRTAAKAMLARLNDPSMPTQAIYIPTQIKYRDTTRMK
ncbi:MAG: LacI family DNA-binding transcriptional regulator [Petrimonas sp.]|nr:LacI family DNA-binding transcriptional regulator [Petrimonas sp.]